MEMINIEPVHNKNVKYLKINRALLVCRAKIECNFVVTEEIVNGLSRKIATNYRVRAGHGKL